MEAAIQFVEGGGRRAVITSLERAADGAGRARGHADRRVRPAARSSPGARRPAAPCPAASARARALLEDPQGFGNYMTYRDAYRILGWDPAEIYRDGAHRARPRGVGRPGLDGQPPSGPRRARWRPCATAVDAEHVGPTRPDLDEPLRDLMAERAAGPRPRRRLRGDRHRGRPGRGRLRRPGLPRPGRRGRSSPTRATSTSCRRCAWPAPSPSGCASSAAQRLAARPGRGGGGAHPAHARWWWSATRSTRSARCSARDELAALLRLSAERRRGDPGRHHPLRPPRRPGGRSTTRSPPWPPSTRAPRCSSSSGMAHGYGMAGARIGALGRRRRPWCGPACR